MIEYGNFTSHSGLMLPFKVNCDALTYRDWGELALIVAGKFHFSHVHGVPRGGLNFAAALRPYCVPGYPTLLVDDVLTTGKSMIEFRKQWIPPGVSALGVVVFSRCGNAFDNHSNVPDWVWPIFTVNEWTQARGTGVG